MSLAEVLPARPRIKRRPVAAPQEAGGSFADVIFDLYKKQRITQRQATAAQMFLRDLSAYHGSTGTGGYSERVDSTLQVGKLAGWTQAHINTQAVLDKLWGHERRTLDYLITKRERARGSLTDFGREICGYKDNDMACAAAASRIASLLESIAEHYLGLEAIAA